MTSDKATLEERVAEWERTADSARDADYAARFDYYLIRDLIARVRELEEQAHIDSEIRDAGGNPTEIGLQLANTARLAGEVQVQRRQLAERDRMIEQLTGSLKMVTRERNDLDNRLAAAEQELELCRSAVREYLDYRAETATPIVADAGPLLWLQACALRAGEGGER